jgi:microcin C transport system substrate-binding protein
MYAAASKLLDEAGWKLIGSERVNAKAEKLAVEILIDSPVFERIVNPYVENLKRIGVAATLRLVDEAQYQRLLESFDFDTIVSRFSTKQTPGVELNAYFSSAAADDVGTFNLAGVKLKAVDALIGEAIRAKSREELTNALRALDRVLRAEYFWVPNWHKASHWVVYWDIFGKPPKKPAYDRGIVDLWWIDQAKAASIRRGN